jgi:predicted PurR-regulated permease PerM
MLEGPWLSRQRVSDAILTLSIFFGIFLCSLLAIPFLPALVWSVTLAVIFWPLDAKVQHLTRSPALSATVTVSVIAFIVIVPAMLVIGTLLNEAVRSAALIGPLIDGEGRTRAIDNHPWLATAWRWVNEQFDIPDLIKALTSVLAGWSGSIVRASFSTVISLLLTSYFLFYLLRDKTKFIAVAKNNLPLTDDEFERIASRAVDTIFATVLGTAAVAALQGGLGGAMFWWLGLPAPVLWGVLMGLLAIVPFLGAFVIWVPTAAFLALNGEYTSAILLAVWGTVVVGLVDNIVYPILVGNRLKLHTIPSFIALVGGLILLGPHGVVLGPLIVAISVTLMEIWARRRVAEENTGA